MSNKLIIGLLSCAAICSSSSQAASAAKRAISPWTNSATRVFYDFTLKLPWASDLGDVKGGPIGSATAPEHASEVDIALAKPATDVTIRRGDTPVTIYSRFNPDPTKRPYCLVNGKRFAVTREARFDNTTQAPHMPAPIMTMGTILLACDDAHPTAKDKASVHLSIYHIYGSTAKFIAFATNAHQNYPPITDVTVNPTIVVRHDGRNAQYGPDPYMNGKVHHILNTDNSVSAFIDGDGLALLSDVHPLPKPMHEAYLTVVLRLDRNWTTAGGGKLPGLTNTGMLYRGPFQIGGADCSPAGWGGRTANGCRWSARTGFDGTRDGMTGLGTYFYAQNPMDVNGIMDFWATPAPLGRYFAYIERVRVNDVGQANGILSYWMIHPDLGLIPQQDRHGIQFRSADTPQALINEVWNDVYCGGRACGPAPAPRSSMVLVSDTVTVGFPNQTMIYQIKDTIRRLNAAGDPVPAAVQPTKDAT